MALKHRSQKMLLLGHSGFVGAHLRMEFARNPMIDSTLCLSAPEIDLAVEECVPMLSRLFEADTTLVFLAGVKRQWGDNVDSFAKNIAIASNVCRALLLKSVARVVFISSAAVYGEEYDNVSISESTATRPTSFYGLAKYTTECLLTQTLRGSKDTTVALLRPPLIYGPGDTSNSYGPSGFAATAKRGESITLWGDGLEQREFLFVGDAARLIAGIAAGGYSGALNLASGTSHTYLDVVRHISSALGRAVTTVSRERSKPKVDHRFSNTTLRCVLPDFQFTTLEEGIRLTLAAQGMAP